MAQVARATPTAPSQVAPEVPRALSAVCLRALSSDPARRYPDAGALALAIDEALHERPRGGWGSPALAALAGALALVAAVAAALGPAPAPSVAPAGGAAAAAPSSTASSAAAEVSSAGGRPAPAPEAPLDDLLAEARRREGAGDLRGAEALLTTALERAPSAPLWNQRGMIVAAQGRWEDAIADYDRALALDPTLSASLHNRGWAHYQLGHHRLALADYEVLVGVRGDWVLAWQNRGLCREALGDLPGALEDYRTSLARTEGRTSMDRQRVALRSHIERIERALAARSGQAVTGPGAGAR
jgi:tetratricopeptide (TPR) repeat protein